MTDEKEIRQQVAERLRIARIQSGLSQGQVAQKLGWHRPTVSEIEAGRRRVSVDEAAILSELYGVDVNWIVTGDRHEADPAIQLAARVLAKLNREDTQRILNLLSRLPKSGDTE